MDEKKCTGLVLARRENWARGRTYFAGAGAGAASPMIESSNPGAGAGAGAPKTRSLRPGAGAGAGAPTMESYKVGAGASASFLGPRRRSIIPGAGARLVARQASASAFRASLNVASVDLRASFNTGFSSSTASSLEASLRTVKSHILR